MPSGTKHCTGGCEHKQDQRPCPAELNTMSHRIRTVKGNSLMTGRAMYEYEMQEAQGREGEEP